MRHTQEMNDTTETNGATKELAPEGSLSSSKNLYQDRDKDGRKRWVDTEPSDAVEAAENEETAQYALITRLVKAEDSRKKYDLHSIIIQSSQLKTALAEILKDYPGIHCGLKRLVFEAPFRPFVHRWSELLDYKSRKDLDSTTAEHLEVLYSVLCRELKDVIKTLEDYVNHGVVTFDHIWTLFQFGTLVYSASHNGTHGAYKLRNGSYTNTQCGSFYSLEVSVIDWDGNNFGHGTEYIRIPEFLGTTQITTLLAYPMAFNPHQHKIKAVLIKRGQKFEQLAGAHYKQYNGIAISWDYNGREVPHHCEGRIVVDSYCFDRYSTQNVPHINSLTSKDGVQQPDLDGTPKGINYDDLNGTSSSYVFGKQEKQERVRLKAEHHLLCVPIVRGYSLKKKQWLNFYVDIVEDIKFNDKAFKALVLPEDQKELILSFAESQAMNRTTFDDIISGKGRGHITLLSGPPGVGKVRPLSLPILLIPKLTPSQTLTAESVSEHMRAPLFMMSAGDLGTNPDQVESKLTRILEMIAKWNAVLLLDECDVFLEARSTHDLERNKLVSIFLRMLEYYEGLLFLTTNRADNIDAAFQSRIHVSMRYPDLSAAARRVIWVNFLDAMGEGTKSAFADKDLDELAEVQLNGRQIKNVLKSAALLAARKRDGVRRAYVDTVLAIERGRPGVGGAL